MTATVMDGRALAAEIKAQLAEETTMMKSAGVQPKIATILVGDDGPSKVYLESKHRAAHEVGVVSENYRLPGTATIEDVSLLIRRLNGDASVNGILLQLPIPSHLDPRST